MRKRRVTYPSAVAPSVQGSVQVRSVGRPTASPIRALRRGPGTRTEKKPPGVTPSASPCDCRPYSPVPSRFQNEACIEMVNERLIEGRLRLTRLAELSPFTAALLREKPGHDRKFRQTRSIAAATREATRFA